MNQRIDHSNLVELVSFFFFSFKCALDIIVGYQFVVIVKRMKKSNKIVPLRLNHPSSFNHINWNSNSDRKYLFVLSFQERGRTFGAIKRFQGALLPIMYKLGVMSAVIMMTLFLAFKGVFIGTLILILNVVFFAVKFGSILKHDHGITQSHGWSPPIHAPIHGGWPPHKDVHLHIHNAHGKPDLSIPYSTLSGNGGWDTQGHTSGVEATWTPGSNYIHTGRAFAGDDLTSYASTQNVVSAQHPDQISMSTAKVIDKRQSERQPTIVMAETKHLVTPYNYINKQNRK